MYTKTWFKRRDPFVILLVLFAVTVHVYYLYMTNKEFFIATLKEEAPLFKKAIDALPDDKHGHKVHDRSRAAGDLAGQLAIQWKAISGVVTSGTAAFDPT
jgi:hypothetical protein